MSKNKTIFTKCIDSTPREKSKLRWIVSLFCFLASFGDYYVYDTIGSTHDHLRSRFISINNNFEYYYNLLYSLYSFVNIFLPFICGSLIIILDLKIIYLILGFFITIGQLVVYFGCRNISIITMLIGRIIFGLGGECLNITQMVMISKWFYKKEIAFPLGISIVVARIGSCVNGVISPMVCRGDDPTNAYLIGVIICLISFGCILVLIGLDSIKDQCINNESNEQNDFPNTSLLSQNSDINNNNNVDITNNTNNPPSPSLKSSFQSLTPLYWLITIICFLSYGSILPYMNISTGFYTQSSYFSTYSTTYSRRLASIYMGIPYFISLFLVPLLGLLMDKVGFRTYILLLTNISLILSFVLFIFINPIAPIIILGFAYSFLSSSVWPLITISVNDKKSVGVAYGTTTAIQNFGMAVNPILVGTILVHGGENKYIYCLAFFIGLAFVGIVVNIIVVIINVKYKGNLLDRIKFEEDQGENKQKFIINKEGFDKNNKSVDEKINKISEKLYNIDEESLCLIEENDKDKNYDNDIDEDSNYNFRAEF